MVLQVRTLLDKANALSKMWNDAPVIVCGDFNSTPKVMFLYGSLFIYLRLHGNLLFLSR
jgi:hypothetical protein